MERLHRNTLFFSRHSAAGQTLEELEDLTRGLLTRRALATSACVSEDLCQRLDAGNAGDAPRCRYRIMAPGKAPAGRMTANYVKEMTHVSCSEVRQVRRN